MKKLSRYQREKVPPVITRKMNIRFLPLEKQLITLVKYFPALKQVSQKTLETFINQTKLPKQADGWLLVPKTKNYHADLKKILVAISRVNMRFINIRQGEITEEYLHLPPKTLHALEYLSNNIFKETPFIIFPIQVGYRFLGESPRRARLLLKKNEFGLGPFEIACLILTHWKHIFNKKAEIGIDAIGGEYGPYKHGVFRYILFIYFYAGYLRFDSRWIGCPDGRFGAATGFLMK